MNRAASIAICTVSLIISACATAAPAAAESPLNGTWKLDLSASELPKIVFQNWLQDGAYGCLSCKPAFTVLADGAFHAVAGQSSFDEASVQVVDDRTVIHIRRKHGKEVISSTDVVTPDGNTMEFSWREFAANGKPITGTGVWDRVAPGPAGSHAVAGSWRERQPDSMSDAALTFTIKIEGDTFRETSGTGESLVTKFAGPPAPFKGDSTGTLVSVRKISGSAIEETDRRDGKVVSVRTLTVVGPRMMEIVVKKSTGAKLRFTARKK